MPEKANQRPSSWFFPTEDPDIFLLCDWNAREKAYNSNCREIRREQLSNYIGKSLIAVRNGADKMT